MRAKFCAAPVRKLCVKKKPLIQKMGGAPLSIHASRMRRRSMNSAMYEASGLRLLKLRPFQSSGTRPMKRSLAAPSSAAESTTRPFMAFCTLCMDERTMTMRRL